MKIWVLIFYGFLCMTQEVIAQAFSFEELNTDGKYLDVPEHKIRSYDGKEINYYRFVPEKQVVANLIFIHGGGAHSRLGYVKLAKTLRDSFSIETILIDLRGHGLSEGKRGDAPKVNSVFKDLNLFVALARKSNKPVYLRGHSSGGGLLLNYSSWKKKAEVDGFLFISPEFGYKSNTERENRIEFAEVKVSKFVLNGMTMGLAMQHSDAVFFNYPEKVQSKNPLILKSITVNMSKSLTPNNPKKQMQNISGSVAIYIGENDELFEPKKVAAFASYPLSNKCKTVSKIVIRQNHLSILNNIGSEIGNTILSWNK
jgi:acylglycerol lipase